MTTRGVRIVSGAIALHLISGAINRHKNSDTNDLYLNDKTVRIVHRHLRKIVLLRLQSVPFDYEEFAFELLCSPSVNHYMHGSPKWVLELEDFEHLGRRGIRFGNYVSGMLTSSEINTLVTILKNRGKFDYDLNSLINRVIEVTFSNKSTCQLVHE